MIKPTLKQYEAWMSKCHDFAEHASLNEDEREMYSMAARLFEVLRGTDDSPRLRVTVDSRVPDETVGLDRHVIMVDHTVLAFDSSLAAAKARAAEKLIIAALELLA